MKRHTKIYLDFFHYDECDFIPCEICQNRAVDIHHIVARGMGGNKTRDFIENLMSLCRDCHEQFGDITECLEYLIKIHTIHMQNEFKDLSHMTEDGLRDCKIALEANIQDAQHDRKIRIHLPEFNRRLDLVNTELDKRTAQPVN